jgi:hypothetical protein
MARSLLSSLRSTLAVTALFGGIAASVPAAADPISILFVGNSYTFGRADPALSYNAANVRDLTAPTQPGFGNTQGSNAYEPHPWGGVPGIFKMLTVQAGLDYDVALSTRNAASLRGHFLNTNPAGWDLRGNVASQRWDKLVLQELSDGPLPVGTTGNARPGSFAMYASQLATYARTPSSDRTTTETQIFGSLQACRDATGGSNTACNASRFIAGNTNSNPDTEVYLYQTWARPNLIAGGFVTTTDDLTGEVTRTTTPITGPYPAADGLERMTADLRDAYAAVLAAQPALFADIAPVGEAFLTAVLNGLATRNMYAPDALTDGLIDLWFADGTHASAWGSYLSALTIYGTVTGRDPRRFGGGEQAAEDLGISEREAVLLQRIAAETLGYPVPAPGAAPILLLGLAALGLALRRRATA